MKKKNISQTNFWKKADNGSAKPVTVAVIIGVVLMLSVGITIAQQTQGNTVINNNRGKKTVAEAHAECPCAIIGQAILERLQQTGGIGTINLTDIPEFNQTLLCEWLDAGYEDYMALTYGLTPWCGFGFSQSQPGSQQSTDVAPWENPLGGFYEIGDGNGGGDGFGGIGNPGGQDMAGEGFAQGENQGGIGNGLQGIPVGLEMVTYEMTAEQVRERVEEVHVWCHGGPEPPLDPGDWTLGQALAFCGGTVGAALQLPAYAVASMVWSFALMLCLDSAIYALIDHWLMEFEVTVSEVFWWCVNFLTGGNY